MIYSKNSPPTLRSLTLTSWLTSTPNMRVSDFVALHLNPSLALRTSDTRQTLCAIKEVIVDGI